ncbi:hypothetical protein [Acrocarpospora catenulata]|uniref:hypothetical protein n=1 Tax=Acrocarpospora catenulata TaxID=2836182 RepID=UPI001BDA5F54|nr:hypothetical protein [Acrocarpospora catenulata]
MASDQNERVSGEELHETLESLSPEEKRGALAYLAGYNPHGFRLAVKYVRAEK